jgi:hypothetical protein
MTDHKEKFVTIPYLDWETKYKPMEEENNRLRGELASKDVVFYLQAPHNFIRHIPNFSIPSKIGHLDLRQDLFVKGDYENILEKVLRDLMWSAREEDIILNKRQAKYYLNEINTRISEFEERKKEATEQLSKLRKEKAEFEEAKQSAYDKINYLPSIVRFLLNIKNI